VSGQLQITSWAVPAFAVPTIGRADIGGTGTRTLDTRFSMGAGATRSSGDVLFSSTGIAPPGKATLFGYPLPGESGPVYSSLNQQALQVLANSPTAIPAGQLATPPCGGEDGSRRKNATRRIEGG
jgi:hypothetical protein